MAAKRYGPQNGQPATKMTEYHQSKDELAGLPDEEVKARLVTVRGLGEWTADWFLARHLARPRAWPAGDLALRKAVLAFYPEAGDMRAFGERFDPFQNLTAHYLLTGSRVQAERA